ncbi:TlpA disulfide reductase family protein [Psychroserpens sp. SPM9]|uniref:TlpA family protein disulfide reductase n=1 Tax=Psychroserpens sp. SPM9 TaxID=2975598 RepID=UPI0021A6D27F|nr:TlpA disulfide reductase family protein [Psychroserpens sp. SPM9]MDG5490688.1 TlpA disulfide reductase family protein [Psychroserpens sp. SPM9]
MKTKFLLLFSVAFLTCTLGFSQKKQLWAKSYINKKAPSISAVKWLTEQPELKGKFILLDFWATWCKPCKDGIPHMNEFSKEFKDALVVVGISAETEAKVKSMKTPVMDYYSALDTSSALNTAYGIQGIPHVVLIDPNGIVRWEGFPSLPGHELTSEVIKAIVEKYNQ